MGLFEELHQKVKNMIGGTEQCLEQVVLDSETDTCVEEIELGSELETVSEATENQSEEDVDIPEGPVEVLLHLNARLQPIHRGMVYEDGIEEVLQTMQWGEVTGGGTMQRDSGEIRSCDIEMLIERNAVEMVIDFIHKIPIPKESYLQIEDKKLQVGEMEGLALYLNGTDLPAEVYQNSDINLVIETLEHLLEGCGEKYSHWEGQKETALYFYGKSFEEMQEKISSFLAEYPLCEKCRVVKIA